MCLPCLQGINTPPPPQINYLSASLPHLVLLDPPFLGRRKAGWWVAQLTLGPPGPLPRVSLWGDTGARGRRSRVQSCKCSTCGALHPPHLDSGRQLSTVHLS